MNGGEQERRFANLIQLGVISEVQPEKGLCRVSFGERVSPLSPWLMGRCGDDKEFWHPDIGEQAIFFSPYGDGSEGIVMIGVMSNKKPLPAGAREGLYIKEFKDGSRIEIDRKDHVVLIKDSFGSYIKMAGGDIIVKSIGGKVRLNPGG
ncbi:MULTISPECIES: phage baseplate assembly protein V [Cloacibacillus]|uniref:phage baseplate assembly protein V n=1 Tax=Cloacibacillus TaxID=508459 RepID=UPI00210939D0|nr:MULTISPECIES: phage baseplate assembly protein V [Cloacibacillus]MCQ4765076.1 phage baseplate assembly protein V [Cloacibacillus evryensis]